MRDGDGCVGLRAPCRTTGSARTSVEPFIGMGLGFGFRLGRVRLGPRGDFVSNERPRTAQLPREWVGGEGGVAILWGCPRTAAGRGEGEWWGLGLITSAHPNLRDAVTVCLGAALHPAHVTYPR